MTISELAEEFLEIYVDAHNGPSEQYDKRLLLRNHILPHLGKLEVDKVKAAHITRYTSAMLKTGVSPATVNLRLKCIKKMFNWAREDMGYITLEDVPVIKMLPTKHVEAQYLTEVQIQALFEAADGDPYWTAFLSLGINCGLRVGEMRALKWSHIDTRSRSLRIVKATASDFWEEGEPKAKQPRTVRLNDSILGDLRGVLRIGPYVFGWPPKGELVGYARVRNAMRRFLAEAGINGVTQPLHIMRHTFGSHMAMKGCPIPTLMKLMGHASVSVTMRYAHLSPDAALDAVALLEGLTPVKPK